MHDRADICFSNYDHKNDLIRLINHANSAYNNGILLMNCK